MMTRSPGAVVIATEPRRRGDRWIVAGLGVPLVVVAIAMGLLWRYKSSPGDQAEAPGPWPGESRIRREAGLPTLVMFAHPMCPCTRASLAELRVLMSEFEGGVAAHVLFGLPAGTGKDWTTSDSWSIAASIPGVRVEGDPDQVEARRFGAMTSGHVVLYGKDGELLFKGGITGSRGHEGDNDGRAQVASRLRAHADTRGGSPVFGCPLDDRGGAALDE